MKNYKKVFNIREIIPVKEHHTISKALVLNENYDILLFSMPKDTNISTEFYEYISIFIIIEGEIAVQGKNISKLKMFITNKNELHGVLSNTESIYLEIILKKGDEIMKNIEKGKIIDLKEKIEYVEGGISNLDIVSKKDLKIMLMAFDKGQRLTPHTAPGDAMVIALEGSAKLQVADEYFSINEGEQFIFPKNIVHNVIAEDEKFKMALILAMEEKPEREQGHHLLKRLGKTKLRPGGITATNWLFEKISFSKDLKVLEVACNEGDNLIGFAKQYGNVNYGIDNNESWLNNGIEKVKLEKLEEQVKLKVGNATELPFEDNFFDVVINEAMLTMLTQKDKERAVREYYRVLKPGGILLTHDVRQIKEDNEEVKKLQHVLHISALPLTLDSWVELFDSAGFKNIEYDTNKMTLLTDEGLLLDEGEEGKNKIMANVLKDKNKLQFFEMANFFKESKENLYYIVIKSEK